MNFKELVDAVNARVPAPNRIQSVSRKFPAAFFVRHEVAHLPLHFAAIRSHQKVFARRE